MSRILSAEQALNQLLAGNDLRYEVNGGIVRLAAAAETTALPLIKVSAQNLLDTADSVYRVESATINMLGHCCPINFHENTRAVWLGEIRGSGGLPRSNSSKSRRSIKLICKSLSIC